MYTIKHFIFFLIVLSSAVLLQAATFSTLNVLDLKQDNSNINCTIAENLSTSGESGTRYHVNPSNLLLIQQNARKVRKLTNRFI